jgi:hypothetical protein
MRAKLEINTKTLFVRSLGEADFSIENERSQCDSPGVRDLTKSDRGLAANHLSRDCRVVFRSVEALPDGTHRSKRLERIAVHPIDYSSLGKEAAMKLRTIALAAIFAVANTVAFAQSGGGGGGAGGSAGGSASSSAGGAGSSSTGSTSPGTSGTGGTFGQGSTGNNTATNPSGNPALPNSTTGNTGSHTSSGTGTGR